MTDETATGAPAQATGTPRLAILLAMAMFVLVVDTSLMNVSISAVVRDLDTTVSGVQSAIALEALVSAAFILIGGKTADLIGRKRAYILGLLGYAVGAGAMVLAQDLRAVIIFWAVIGGLGASLLLPGMQSLIHGNFEGAAQKKVYALVGAAAAIAAAVGPLLGGFITTYFSWRVAFGLEVVIIAIVLSGSGLVREVPYTGPREVDFVGNQRFGDRALGKVIASAPTSWARRVLRVVGTRRCLDPTEVPRDVARLLLHYRRSGYPRAQVTPTVAGEGYDGALVLCGKHKGANENNIAEALKRVRAGGTIVIAGGKEDGIIKQLFRNLGTKQIFGE